MSVVFTPNFDGWARRSRQSPTLAWSLRRGSRRRAAESDADGSTCRDDEVQGITTCEVCAARCAITFGRASVEHRRPVNGGDARHGRNNLTLGLTLARARVVTSGAYPERHRRPRRTTHAPGPHRATMHSSRSGQRRDATQARSRHGRVTRRTRRHGSSGSGVSTSVRAPRQRCGIALGGYRRAERSTS